MRKVLLIALVSVLAFFAGRRSVSFTHVPEFKLQVVAPPAFAYTSFCMNCSFEPWQKVAIEYETRGNRLSFGEMDVSLSEYGASIRCPKSLR